MDRYRYDTKAVSNDQVNDDGDRRQPKIGRHYKWIGISVGVIIVCSVAQMITYILAIDQRLMSIEQ